VNSLEYNEAKYMATPQRAHNTAYLSHTPARA
jgi:hypothetical protein